ncbi:hypothetical protein KAU33_05260, partial [Candidatus Dependentiae bacterium]|nr:hypothetical protein [Candidatus Dependentiae bacterium]
TNVGDKTPLFLPNYNTYPKYYTSHQSSLAWRMIEDNNKRTIECKKYFFSRSTSGERRLSLPRFYIGDYF